MVRQIAPAAAPTRAALSACAVGRIMRQCPCVAGRHSSQRRAIAEISAAGPLDAMTAVGRSGQGSEVEIVDIGPQILPDDRVVMTREVVEYLLSDLRMRLDAHQLRAETFDIEAGQRLRFP